MSKEIDDLFKDVELDDISDLEDINIDKVDEILNKYNLDDISADATHADKIINEAYAMVNEKKFIKFEDRIIRKIKEVISKW